MVDDQSAMQEKTKGIGVLQSNVFGQVFRFRIGRSSLKKSLHKLQNPLSHTPTSNLHQINNNSHYIHVNNNANGKRVTISLFYHILLDQLVLHTEQKQAGVKRFLICQGKIAFLRGLNPAKLQYKTLNYHH